MLLQRALGGRRQRFQITTAIHFDQDARDPDWPGTAIVTRDPSIARYRRGARGKAGPSRIDSLSDESHARDERLGDGEQEVHEKAAISSPKNPSTEL